MRDWEKVDPGREALRRLHRCDVRVDEDRVDALLLQRLECLGSRVVELACEDILNYNI